MKKILFFLAVGIFALVIVVLGLKLLAPKTPAQPSGDGGTTFPIGTGGTTGGGGTTVPSTIKVAAVSGEPIETKDFIHNNVTINDPANPDNYYLAGSSGACRDDGTCPVAGTNTDFAIVYWSKTNEFTIALLTEPLGKTRTQAEQYLMQQLGITTTQMCKLKYTLTTISGVNEAYAGDNLGFSFCPGAVKLP